MKPLMIVLSALVAFSALNADAKRLGSGKSSGTQRSAPAAQSPAAPAAAPAAATAAPAAAAAPKPAAPAAPAAAPAAPPPKPSFMQKWGPMLGGLALGGLLGSMLGAGAGAQMLGMLLNALLIGVVVFFAVRWWKSRQAANQPALAGAGTGASATGSVPAANAPSQFQALPEAGQSPSPGSIGAGAAAAAGAASLGATSAASDFGQSPRIPADFDQADFLAGAKAMFNRLQAANDKADATTLRDMMTDAMYADVAADLKGAQQHHTEVLSLNAEIIEVVTEGDSHWASVRFHGLIREDGAEIAAPFSEVWNLQKPVSGAHGWLLAGIQQ